MPLTTAQTRQVTTLSRQTGLDPRVVIAALAAGVPATRLGSLNGRQGKPPGQALVDVSRSTGTDIQRLFSSFESLFSLPALGSSYMGPGTAPMVASELGASASDWTSFSLSDVPGAVSGGVGQAGQAVGGAEAAAAGAAQNALTSWTRWVEGYALRVGEAVGGFLLVLAGLYLLARQVGLAADVPGGAQIVQAVS